MAAAKTTTPTPPADKPEEPKKDTRRIELGSRTRGLLGAVINQYGTSIIIPTIEAAGGDTEADDWSIVIETAYLERKPRPQNRQERRASAAKRKRKR